MIVEPHRRVLNQTTIGRLSGLYRAGASILPPAVAVQPGRGFVLVLGEHRFAALQGDRPAGSTVDVYVVRAWEDVVAWMMADLEHDQRYGAGTHWDYVTAAHMANKLVSLVKSSRSDRPVHDVAEYTNLNENGLSNTLWAIAREADPNVSEPMREWLRHDLIAMRRGESSAHSVRTRYKGHETRLKAAFADPARQLETLRRALIQLKAAAEAVDSMGVLAQTFDKDEAAKIRDEIMRAHRPIIRLQTQLKERATGS